MHIRNEARPVQPTKPNTNRVRVVALPTEDKPQPRHAERVLAARKSALSDPRVAAGIARERAQWAVDQARHDLAEANLALAEAKAGPLPTETKEDGSPADTLADFVEAADKAQSAYIAAKAALAELQEVTS